MFNQSNNWIGVVPWIAFALLAWVFSSVEGLYIGFVQVPCRDDAFYLSACIDGILVNDAFSLFSLVASASSTSSIYRHAIGEVLIKRRFLFSFIVQLGLTIFVNSWKYPRHRSTSTSMMGRRRSERLALAVPQPPDQILDTQSAAKDTHWCSAIGFDPAIRPTFAFSSYPRYPRRQLIPTMSLSSICRWVW